MTVSTTLTTLSILLALLLISAGWTWRKPTWQLASGPPAESQNRIPLTEFYAEARKRGWDFVAHRELCLDLAIGLRQAGLEGAIDIWGRKCQAIAFLTTPRQPLVKIPPDFWKHHEIDGLRMVIIDNGTGATEGLETNNFAVGTRDLPTGDADFDNAAYKDIHLNYIQAMDWLKTDAEPYKGISKRGVTRQASQL